MDEHVFVESGLPLETFVADVTLVSVFRLQVLVLVLPEGIFVGVRTGAFRTLEQLLAGVGCFVIS